MIISEVIVSGLSRNVELGGLVIKESSFKIYIHFE